MVWTRVTVCSWKKTPWWKRFWWRLRNLFRRKPQVKFKYELQEHIGIPLEPGEKIALAARDPERCITKYLGKVEPE